MKIYINGIILSHDANPKKEKKIFNFLAIWDFEEKFFFNFFFFCGGGQKIVGRRGWMGFVVVGKKSGG